MDNPTDNHEILNADGQPNKSRRKKSIVWEHLAVQAVGAGCAKAYCKSILARDVAYITSSRLAGTNHLKETYCLGSGSWLCSPHRHCDTWSASRIDIILNVSSVHHTGFRQCFESCCWSLAYRLGFGKQTFHCLDESVSNETESSCTGCIGNYSHTIKKVRDSVESPLVTRNPLQWMNGGRWKLLVAAKTFTDSHQTFWYPQHTQLPMHSSMEVCKIQLELTHAAISDEDPLACILTRPLLEKFDKYWRDCCLVLAIAVVMDPRFKVKLVEFCFSKIYGASVEAWTKMVKLTMTTKQKQKQKQKCPSLMEQTLLSSADDGFQILMSISLQFQVPYRPDQIRSVFRKVSFAPSSEDLEDFELVEGEQI
ncbi:hAT-like transposase, RNase-H fold [Dillenia turbinata]|uniref:HAT-like transposase, RNase-H fold n=1 Tax=Dillenia turbinata TaxID=194707 RepID=A0AAN8YTC1_9MAGN